MVDLRELSESVLFIILIGFLIGIGVIMSDKLGSTSYYTYEKYNDTITPTNNSLTALDKGNITSIRSVKLARTQADINSPNFTINSTPGQFVLTEQANATPCTICNNTINGTDVEVVYDYKDYATKTRDTAKDVSTEIGNISSNWLGLIVTIIILSLIILLISRSFFLGGARK